MNELSQILITLFGGAALWLMNGRSERSRRAGVVCGLCSQPWWYVQLVTHGQWLMLPVFLLYTASWLRGLWNFWLRRRA